MQNYNNINGNYGNGYPNDAWGNGYQPQRTVPNWMNQNGYSPANNQESSFNNVMVVQVNGMADASEYPVAMGNTVLLMDYKNRMFWLKTNDGVSTKMVQHNFTVDTPEEQDKTEEFVTKKEFDEFKKFIKNSNRNMKGNKSKNEQSDS